MTDEQKSANQEPLSDFGEIQIESQPESPRSSAPGAASRSRRRISPVSRPSARRSSAGRRRRPDREDDEEPGEKRQPSVRAGRKKGWLCLAFLLIAPLLLFALYLAGTLHFFPLFAKGRLAERLGRQLGRQVAISEASLSPFGLDLHLGGIVVGADVRRKEDSELARIAAMDAHVQPAALLRGKIVLERVRIDQMQANLTRYADGSYTNLSADNSGAGLLGNLKLLPDWLRVRGLHLTGSTVQFWDQPNGRKHVAEKIDFILPAADKGQQPTEPALSAVVNSSPVLIRGQRQVSGGKTETRLSLQLANIDPQKYLAWLPGLAHAATISTERTDAALEIIFQDAHQTGQGPAITGTITASALQIESSAQAKNAFKLNAAKVKSIIRAMPLQHLYTVEELVADEPRLILPDDRKDALNGAQLAAKAAALLNPEEELGLAVDKLRLSKGSIKSGEQEWQDVNLELSSFQNAKAAALADEEKKTAELSLSARSGEATVSFKGNADPALNLSGSIALRNMDADLLRPYLATEKTHFAKGSADISGLLQLEQAKGRVRLNLSGSSIALRDFILNWKKVMLVSGKALNGTGCILDASNGTVCNKVVLDQADFAGDAVAAFLSSGTADKQMHVACKALELNNSSAVLRLPDAEKKPLTLSDLKLSLNEEKSLRLEAAVRSQEEKGGRTARFEFQGKMEEWPNLSGKLSLQNADADLLDPYLTADGDLHFAQGSATLSGTLRLSQAKGKTVAKLAESSISLKDFALQQHNAALVSGKSLTAADCTADVGRGIACRGLMLDQAAFAADALAAFLPSGNADSKRRFAFKTVELNNASAVLQLPDAAKNRLFLSALNLNLNEENNLRLEAAVRNQGEQRGAHLSFQGKADGWPNLSGKLSLENAAANLLDPYLSADGDMHFAQGSATLSGTLRLSQAKGRTAAKLTDSSISLKDFALQRRNAALVSAKGLTAADCAADAGRGIACASIMLDQADFAADALAAFLPSGNADSKRPFACKTVELNNSSAVLRLPDAEKKQLILSALNLSLNEEKGLRIAAAVRSQGEQREAHLAFQGKAEEWPNLSGKLSLENAAADLLDPYLSADGTLHFAQGSATLSGTLRLSQAKGKTVAKLADSSISLKDFALQRHNAALVSGKGLTAADCAADAGHGIACASIVFDQAAFAADAPGFLFAPDSNGLTCSCGRLTAENSSAVLRLASQTEIPLSSLRISLNERKGFDLAAAVGSRGKIEARRDGSAPVEFTASDLDIRLFSKAAAGLFREESAPELNQGSLTVKGRYSLTDKRFAGEFSIDQLAAENSKGDALRWQLAAGAGTAAFSPFAATIDKLSLRGPVVRLAAGDSSIAAALLALLRPQENKVLDIGSCAVSNGMVEHGQVRFSGIEGTAGPLKAGSDAQFAFAGKMGGGDFRIKGKIGSNGADIDELTLAQLPLTGVAKKLAAQLGADAAQAKVSRTLAGHDKDQLDFAGFSPRPDSDFALLLALLTDARGTFSLHLAAMPAAASEAAISKAASEALQRLRLQSVAAPEKILPELAALPKSIDFIAGDKVPDFMKELEGYAALFKHRPHIGLAVRGCWDSKADQEQMLAQVRDSEAKRIKEENLRREKKMKQLIADEEKRQKELKKAGKKLDKDRLPEIKKQADLQPLSAKQGSLSEQALNNLAQARAEVIREHLVSTLKLPAERIKLKESGSCGSQVDLFAVPAW